MLDCQVSLLNYMATMYLMSGEAPGRSGNEHFVHVPYNTYRTKTRHLIVAVIADNGWESLVDMLDDETLKRPEFTTQPGRLAQRDFINTRLQDAFAQQPCEYWLEKLARARVPAAPVNEFSDVFADEQVLSRNMRVRVPLKGGGSVDEPGNPIKLSDTFEDTYSAPPTLGEHTRAVLREFLDLDPGRLDALARDGIIETQP
jgi:crotonobetainyl-CoA:carnitine CoA-transferase CaiB-like acyl-CoA transferase